MKKQLFIFILLCFVSFPCLADKYHYVAVTSSLKEIDNGEYKLDLPFEVYSQESYYKGINVTYNLKSVHPVDKEVFSIVAVIDKDADAVKAYSGYIGYKKANIKLSQLFKKHFPCKVKDIKRKAHSVSATLWNIIEYAGSDAEDQADIPIAFKESKTF